MEHIEDKKEKQEEETRLDQMSIRSSIDRQIKLKPKKDELIIDVVDNLILIRNDVSVKITVQPVDEVNGISIDRNLVYLAIDKPIVVD